MTDSEWAQLYTQIAGDLLGVERPADVDALEQLLRTRTHPDVHEARSRVHGQLFTLPPASQRRFAHAVSADTLRGLHTAIAHAVEAYRNGELSVEQYIELLLLIAIFDKGMFDELMTVLLAIESRARLAARLVKTDVRTQEQLWEEHASLQRELWQQRRDDAPVLVREIEPLVITTDHGEYLLPARVRLYNALTGDYTLDVDEPRRAQKHTVTRTTTLPWRDAQTGVLLHLSLPDDTGWHHTPVHIMLWPHELSAMRDKGSAVPTRIGHGEEIDVHTDFFPSDRAANDILATARVTPGGLEIRKIQPDLQLTVTA